MEFEQSPEMTEFPPPILHRSPTVGLQWILESLGGFLHLRNLSLFKYFFTMPRCILYLSEVYVHLYFKLLYSQHSRTKMAKFGCLVIWNHGPSRILGSSTYWGSNFTFLTSNSKHRQKVCLLESNMLYLDAWWFEIRASATHWGGGLQVWNGNFATSFLIL
jgi:hypothetical protein